jgi:quercetin dioxygenase-like cupin family protein
MESITWSEVPVEEVYRGIARQILHGASQTMVRYVYAPGSEFPVHSHPEEQVTVVVSGEIVFTIDGEPVALRAGQAAVIPANMPHGAKVIGETMVETFNALSPRRERQPEPTRETGK